jgi:hypothetical protein
VAGPVNAWRKGSGAPIGHVSSDCIVSSSATTSLRARQTSFHSEPLAPSVNGKRRAPRSSVASVLPSRRHAHVCHGRSGPETGWVQIFSRSVKLDEIVLFGELTGSACEVDPEFRTRG